MTSVRFLNENGEAKPLYIKDTEGNILYFATDEAGNFVLDEASEVMVFVEVSQSGNHTHDGRDFVTVHSFPCFKDFIHGVD